MVTLLWASKFGTAKMDCSFEMGKQKPLGGTIYFTVDFTLIYNISFTKVEYQRGSRISDSFNCRYIFNLKEIYNIQSIVLKINYC